MPRAKELIEQKRQEKEENAKQVSFCYERGYSLWFEMIACNKKKTMQQFASQFSHYQCISQHFNPIYCRSSSGNCVDWLCIIISRTEQTAAVSPNVETSHQK